MESSNIRNDEMSDLSKGLDLIMKSLFEGAKKASFRLGFGALAMGLTYLGLLELIVPEHIKILIGLGVFFISARIGGFLDEYFDSKVPKTDNKNSESTHNDDRGNLLTAPKNEGLELKDIEKQEVVERIKTTPNKD